MAGLVPAIHVLPRRTKNVDARDKPGHDGLAILESPLRGAAAYATICSVTRKLYPQGKCHGRSFARTGGPRARGHAIGLGPWTRHGRNRA
ncbi:hypothetical protein EAS62_00070 [Bradyrhizobium zhanjiangense]|uniref:Transposase n=1 Tax=Bradyrhizobium zhanjiangense TaxID=1325107 RepID=A0ABY0DSP2_9BRAD|nr:hypothetical protein EAS62_00070 [Bradyrhizobium zhanjiangense]